MPFVAIIDRHFQIFFPIDDVVRNIRHFLGSVKRATGNEKDTEVDTKKTKGPKAGELVNGSSSRPAN